MAALKHVLTLRFLPEWMRNLLVIALMTGFTLMNFIGRGMCTHSLFDRLWPGC